MNRINGNYVYFGMMAPFRVLLVVSFSFLALGPLSAAGPEPPLPTKKTLAKMLAEEAQILPEKISIAVVVRGETSLGEDFGTHHAIHVTFLWPVLQNGRLERVVQNRVFLWNEEYGWFSYWITERHGSPSVEICSEKMGLIEVK